jgi:hypothetical protein
LVVAGDSVQYLYQRWEQMLKPDDREVEGLRGDGKCMVKIGDAKGFEAAAAPFHPTAFVARRVNRAAAVALSSCDNSARSSAIAISLKR